MSTPSTLVHRIQRWAADKPGSPALFDRGTGQWRSYTWTEYWETVRQVGKGLMKLGVQPGDCVAIIGANRAEWVFFEFGIMAIGAIPAPIYVTNTTEQVAFILQHSECTVAICDDVELLDKYRDSLGEDGVRVQHLVTMLDLGVDDDIVMTLDALREGGREVDDTAFDERLANLDPEATGLLIYTSGTTGTPKAVQLDHVAMCAMGDALIERAGLEPSAYKVLSYLPLCHVAEQLFTNMSHLAAGGEVWFCPDLAQLKDYLAEVRPTVFLGVPRVWEKFEAALRARFAEAEGFKKKLLEWALATELRSFRKEVNTGRTVWSPSRALASKIVISKLKHALGLENVQVAGTGAAPISTSTLEFFASLGIPLAEGYGMSETTGIATTSHIQRPVFGYVGSALPGVEIRIAADGEIQLRGRTMTRGYLRQPEQTAELFTDDGWLCTGDLGSLDGGLLKITGRKKDLLITAGGKNVAPIEIESHLKSIPGIGHAVVVGDRQPYLAALLTLDVEGLAALCAKLGIPNGGVEAVAGHEKVRAHLQDCIDRGCNEKLARYQTIKKFDVLPVEFTVDGGELTPTMKLKRNVISEKYAAQIAALYV